MDGNYLFSSSIRHREHGTGCVSKHGFRCRADQELLQPTPRPHPDDDQVNGVDRRVIHEAVRGISLQYYGLETAAAADGFRQTVDQTLVQMILQRLLNFGIRTGRRSAPVFSDRSFDRVREMQTGIEAASEGFRAMIKLISCSGQVAGHQNVL